MFDLQPPRHIPTLPRLCENSRARRWRRMFFSTVILNGGGTPLMHPEMQFRRIVFSTFCPRASFHTAWTHSRPRTFGRIFLAQTAMAAIANCGWNC
jgi:hypothetical protein